MDVYAQAHSLSVQYKLNSTGQTGRTRLPTRSHTRTRGTRKAEEPYGKGKSTRTSIGDPERPTTKAAATEQLHCEAPDGKPTEIK